MINRNGTFEFILLIALLNALTAMLVEPVDLGPIVYAVKQRH